MILPSTKGISGMLYVSGTTGHPLDCHHSVLADRDSMSHMPWTAQKEDSQANATTSFVT